MLLLKGKRIFIIEDNIANRAITQMLLEQHGARVAIDRWGMDALEKLKKFAPVDLIILDLMFPGGVSGYDIFEQIRGDESFADVPIVAVSAADPSTAIPETQARGFTGFISKPLEFGLFVQQIVQVLDGEAVWHGLGQF